MDRHYGTDETFLILHNFCKASNIDLDDLDEYETLSKEELTQIAHIQDAYLTGLIFGLPIKDEEKRALATLIVRSLALEACLAEKCLANENIER